MYYKKYYYIVTTQRLFRRHFNIKHNDPVFFVLYLKHRLSSLKKLNVVMQLRIKTIFILLLISSYSEGSFLIIIENIDIILPARSSYLINNIADAVKMLCHVMNNNRLRLKAKLKISYLKK